MNKSRTKPKALVVRPGSLDANMMMYNNVKAIQSAGFDVVTVSWNVTGAPIKTSLDGLRGYVFQYNIYRSKIARALGYLFWQFFVAAAILRERPDVVHAMNSISHFGILAMKPLLGYRVVMDFRDCLGLMLSGFPFPLPQAVSLHERLCARFSDAVMGSQGDIGAMYRYLGPWALRGREICNVLCVPNFTFPVEPSAWPEGKFIINISGHISARRGAFLALEAFGGHDKVMLEFIGDIPRQKGILEAINACPNAVCLGKVGHVEAIERMKRSSLIWLYYDISMESVAIASSCKMFEAMAVGRPYLTASGCWMGATAEKHGLGFTLPYGDPRAVRGLVDKLIAHPRRLREAGRRGREAYLAHYTWDQACQPLARMYSTLAKDLCDDKDGMVVSGQGAEPDTARSKSWRIVPATAEHLPGIAACHITCFPDVFASRMGLPFLLELYERYLKDPDVFLLAGVETQSDRLLGAVAGGRPGMWREFTRMAIRKYPGRLAYKLLVDGVVRRAICREVLRRFDIRRSGEQRHMFGDPKWSADRKFAALRVLCVLPFARGGGLAGGLTEAFGKACWSAGYDWMYLDVLPENKRGIAFYRKDGWETVAESKTSLLMIRPSQPPAGK